MGCWNHTCALTNLPIFCGDQVYVLLLEETPSSLGQDFCYPTTYFSPYPFWFQGDYNDYGGVENCRGPFLNRIIDHVKSNLVEFDLGENECHDIPVKKEDFNVEVLFDADHESRLYVRPRIRFSQMKQDNLRLKHIVISHDVMERFLDKYKVEFWYPKKRSYTFPQALIEMEKELAIIMGEGDEISKEFRFFRLDSGTRDTLFWRCIQDAFKFSGMNILEYINESTPVIDQKEILYQLAVSYWLHVYMTTSRNQWIPPSGAGSQSDTTYAQETMAKVTIESAKVIKHRYDEVDIKQYSA